MITFVYKTGFEDKKKGDDYKPPRRNSKSKKLSSQPTDDSSKLSQQATDVAHRDGVPPVREFLKGRTGEQGQKIRHLQESGGAEQPPGRAVQN